MLKLCQHFDISTFIYIFEHFSLHIHFRAFKRHLSYLRYFFTHPNTYVPRRQGGQVRFPNWHKLPVARGWGTWLLSEGFAKFKVCGSCSAFCFWLLQSTLGSSHHTRRKYWNKCLLEFIVRLSLGKLWKMRKCKILPSLVSRWPASMFGHLQWCGKPQRPLKFEQKQELKFHMYIS